MAKKSAAQLNREINDALARCPDCARPFDPVARRHTIDPAVNRFLVPGCCAADYGAANPAWRPTRAVPAKIGHARTKASAFGPHALTSTRTVEREKLATLRPRFPVGARVKIVSDVSPEYIGAYGKVVGYDLGSDDDEALIKVRYEQPIQAGSVRSHTGKYHDGEITPVAHGARVTHAVKKGAWSVVVEDGYVKVKRGDETIAAAVDTGGKRLRDIEFTRPEYQRSNPTRQKAMRTLQEKGYR